MSVLRTLLGTVTALALALAVGCSASGSSDHSGGGGSGGSGTGGLGATGGSGGFGALGNTGNCTGPHCSSDLHTYVDCDGNVLKTCPSDQGCVPGGKCVKACDSAVANKSTIGCDYYSVEPDISSDGTGACFAAYVVNTWSTPVNVLIEYGGQQYDVSQFGYIPSGTGASIQYKPLAGNAIPAGQVAILFLSQKPNPFSPGLNFKCPAGVNKMLNVDAAAHGTSIGNAFHIITSAPITAYDIYPYGGGQSAITSATLLIPTSAWDSNYIAVDAFGAGISLGTFGSSPFVEVVAQKDGTKVKVNPTVPIIGGNGVAPGPAGQETIYSIDKGQVLQFTQGKELAGSVIQSSAPVGVWGGKTSLGIEACCDDSAHQQIPPVKALGSEYVAIRYRNRYDGKEESPPWRLIGAVDGTKLAYDPAPPAGAPSTLKRGQLVTFNDPGPFVVRSQDEKHPFYMSAHMTGGGLYDPDPQGNSDGRGDAEFVNVIPPGEYLQKYIFFADPTYPETDLVIVRIKGNKGFADVKLDCAGNLTGWQPVGKSGKYEYTRFDLSRHNFQGQNGCDNGRHVISSTSSFGVTVWGWGSAETGTFASGFYTQYVSYAYPAGAGVAPINDVVIPTIK